AWSCWRPPGSCSRRASGGLKIGSCPGPRASAADPKVAHIVRPFRVRTSGLNAALELLRYHWPFYFEVCIRGALQGLANFGIGTLVPRTRSSHHCAAASFADFGFKCGTRIIELLVSL